MWDCPKASTAVCPWEALSCFYSVLSLSCLGTGASRARQEGLGGHWSSQSCSPVVPSPLHCPQVCDRRKEQFLSAIYWCRAPGAGQGPTHSLPNIGSSPVPVPSALAMPGSASPWADPCFGQALYSSFLFIPLPELFKHPHLDFYASGATPLPLCPNNFSLRKERNKLFFCCLGLCAPNTAILLDFLPFFLLVFSIFLQRDCYYGTSIRTSFPQFLHDANKEKESKGIWGVSGCAGTQGDVGDHEERGKKIAE